MSETVTTCGVCQNSYPKEQFVLCNNGREVCLNCVDSQGGAVSKEADAANRGVNFPENEKWLANTPEAKAEVDDVRTNGNDEPANPSNA